LSAALLGEVVDGDEVFEQGDQDLFAGFALADVVHGLTYCCVEAASNPSTAARSSDDGGEVAEGPRGEVVLGDDVAALV
jgi:hypothetical protein